MTVSVSVTSLPGPRSDAEAAVAGVLAVVDAFDVMTHERPYRAAQPASWALAELKRCAGAQFDPAVVETFLHLQPAFAEVSG